MSVQCLCSSTSSIGLCVYLVQLAASSYHSHYFIWHEIFNKATVMPQGYCTDMPQGYCIYSMCWECNSVWSTKTSWVHVTATWTNLWGKRTQSIESMLQFRQCTGYYIVDTFLQDTHSPHEVRRVAYTECMPRTWWSCKHNMQAARTALKMYLIFPEFSKNNLYNDSTLLGFLKSRKY